jgi:hypothetical protein
MDLYSSLYVKVMLFVRFFFDISDSQNSIGSVLGL